MADEDDQDRRHVSVERDTSVDNKDLLSAGIRLYTISICMIGSQPIPADASSLSENLQIVST